MNDSGPRDRPAIGDTPAATDVALAALDAALAASPLKPRLLTTIEGFNLNGGRKLSIAVFAKEPG